MREADELVVILGVGTQTADGYLHAALVHTVQPGLRTVGLLEVVQEQLGCGGELQLLGAALVGGPAGLHLVHGGLLVEAHEHGGHVAVGRGDAQALGGDERLLGVHDDAVFNAAPDLHGLLLALFLLTADVGDDVVDHLGPGLEGLAGTGNGLISADEDLVEAEVSPEGGEGRDVALDGAVRLDCDEAALGAKALFLRGDDGEMLGVYLGDDHRNVRGPAVGAVVGDDGALGLGVLLLEGEDLFLLHIDGGEDKIDVLHHVRNVRGILDDDGLRALGHRLIERPLSANGLLIGLARAARARRDSSQLEPRVIGDQRDVALTHHAGASYDSDLQFLHA